MAEKYLNLTPRQREILDALEREGSQRKAARALGIARTTLKSTLEAIQHKGLVPAQLSNVETPDGMGMTKTTVQYDGDGNVVQEWRRLSPTQQLAEDVVDSLCDKVRGKLSAPKRRDRKSDTDEILFELDIFDPHIGMYADRRETKDADYTCDKAVKRMLDACWDLSLRAEPQRPHKAVVVFGGDTMHSDTRNNRTEASGHPLDVDSRYHRVVQHVTAVMRDVVRIAATVAKEVEVVVVEGNHDWHSCVWMSYVLAAAYENAPNVHVNVQASPRKYMRWGKNLLGWAHGDKIKPPKWPMIVAAEIPELWGATKWRYMRLGHIHHQKVIAPVQIDEQAGLVVEFLPALCPADAWSANEGFIGSQKGASGFIYHKDTGLHTRLYHNVQ